MGFSQSQAQWLVQFMRNLPGGAPQQTSEAEYEEAMAAQRMQAAAQAPEGPENPFYDPYAYPGYEAPPFGYRYWDYGTPAEW
jgi:hypothetical protein